MNNQSTGHTLSSVDPNNDQTTELVDNGDPAAQKSDPPASSPPPSPSTSASQLATPDVKIDSDYQGQESDARHEPMPVNSVQHPDSTPSALLIEPSTDASPDLPDGPTLPSPSVQQPAEDVKMEDTTHPVESNGVNGLAHDDVIMRDMVTETSPIPITPDASMASIASNGIFERDDDQPPPAKRARMHSDADQASLAQSATPPPASAIPSTGSTPAPSSSPVSTLTAAQFKFCLSTIRSLKKMKDAGPFLKPVDYVALNVPHYPSIIKNPMDFLTVERKLSSSNPAKPDPNSSNPRYFSADEFISDVRLIFQNCITFNGPDHAITLMGKRVEQVFDKQIKQMPVAETPKLPVVKKVATPPPPPPPPTTLPKKSNSVARRMSTSVPVIRRSDTEAAGRPKREIHPPPPKDLAYVDAPKKHRKHKVVKDDGTSEQLKFCAKVLAELHRKQHYAIAHPFYEPVDWVKLELPTYPKMIKKPMDLSTMRKKLDSVQYPTAQKFFDDFKLMIRNCFTFNPAGTPVNQAGIELQRVFDEKWKQLPPLRDVMSEDEDDEDNEDDSEADRLRAIADMESQIETMRGNIAALKNSKLQKEKKKKDKREKHTVLSSSSKSSTHKPPKAPTKKKNGKVKIPDNDVLTFEQKKDLSESIAKLDEVKLEKVIQIIHEGVPEIRDSTEEIELEIDLLPAPVLTKLYNFVIRPMRPPATKRNRTGKGTGTGGLKRKSMDEDVEAEKIRLLEERMRLFDKTNGGATVPTRPESDRSSDSSDGSDSSGSDSE